MDDIELLGRYAQRQDQQAFSTLIERHEAWVYAAARRRVRDEHAAEDVAQAVFAMLARRAGKLKGYGYLSGWLFRALSYCTEHVQREKLRRSRREAEAARMRSEVTSMEADWEEIAPELEAAVGKLGKADRDAVLLRFYEQRPLAEVGRCLGISEKAAQKRVERAVGRLREKLAGKGVEVEAGSLGAIVLAHAAGGGGGGAAGLVEKVMAGIGGGGAGSGTAGLIAKGAEKMMVWAKVKVAAVVLGGLCLAAGVAAAVVSATPAKGHDAAATAPSAQTNAAVVVLPGGGSVELVGIAKYPSNDKSWWQPNGSVMATAPCDSLGVPVDPIAVLVTEGNAPLQQAIAGALPRSGPKVITPKEYAANPPYYADLVVFDRYQPKSLGINGMFLYFGSVPPHWQSQSPPGQNSVPASNGALVVSNWKRDHMALRGMPLGKLAIARAMHMAPPPSAEVLVESSQGPLIVFDRDRLGGLREHMVVAFGASDANWDAGGGLGTFVSNAVEYLTQTAHDSYRQFQFALKGDKLPAGAAISVRISPAAPDWRGVTGSCFSTDNMKNGDPVPGLISAQWNLKPTADAATIRVLLAPDAKETSELECDGSVTDEAGATVRQFLPASTSEQVGPSGKQAVLTLGIAPEAAGRYEWSVRAIDVAAKEHASAFSSAVEVDGKTKSTVGFALPLEQISYFILTARPYRYEVTFENVPLDVSKRADVKCGLSELRP